MTDQQAEREQQLSRDLADCFFELVGSIVGHAEQMAQRFAVPAPFIKALHFMDVPIAMRDLGKRMHCDPSFVTLVADMLEKRGLGRREPHPADRRVKNLVLTKDGMTLKQSVEAELAASMPWNTALDETERCQLLALIRKMLRAEGSDATTSGAAASKSPGPLSTLLAKATCDDGQQASAPDDKAAPATAPRTHTDTPPPGTGEVTSAGDQSPAGG